MKRGGKCKHEAEIEDKLSDTAGNSSMDLTRLYYHCSSLNVKDAAYTDSLLHMSILD